MSGIWYVGLIGFKIKGNRSIWWSNSLVKLCYSTIQVKGTLNSCHVKSFPPCAILKKSREEERRERESRIYSHAGSWGFQWVNTLLFLQLFHLFLWMSSQRILYHPDTGSQHGLKRERIKERSLCCCLFLYLISFTSPSVFIPLYIPLASPFCPVAKMTDVLSCAFDACHTVPIHSEWVLCLENVCVRVEGRRRPRLLTSGSQLTNWANKLNVTGIMGQGCQSSGVKHKKSNQHEMEAKHACHKSHTVSRPVSVTATVGVECDWPSQRHDVSGLKSQVSLWSRKPVTGSCTREVLCFESITKSRDVKKGRLF